MKAILRLFLTLLTLFTLLSAQTPTIKNITKLYIATFNRVPDMAGLEYWLYDSGLNLEGIAESFFDQNETKAKYPDGTTPRKFITTIYENLFSREPDTQGLNYWIDELSNHRIKRSNFILAVMNGALGRDAYILNKKTYSALEELGLCNQTQAYFSKTSGAYYDGGVDNIIIQDINNSKDSIYMAVYSLTNRHITQALIDAYNRGVDVKVVTDDKNMKYDRIKELQDSGIVVHSDNNLDTLMHDKFIVIDDKIVWSGSGNYTVYAFYRNNENFVRVEDSDIADVYTQEFWDIFDNTQTIQTPYSDKCITVYYSPEYRLENALIDRIDSAKSSIDFMIYAFTDKDVADALIRAKNRGVEVRGVIDKDENDGYLKDDSKYNYLLDNGIAIRLDGGSFKLHDKVTIIDGQIVLTGSYNYTKKASNTNRENLIVIDREDIAYEYEEEFEKIWKEAE